MVAFKNPFFKQMEQKAGEIHFLLIDRGKTLAVAESLTGGLVSYLLTIRPGASRFFLGSMVSYSYSTKIKHLSVPKELLIEKGAVNESVCRLMSQGVKKNYKSDYALAITGVAGPGRMEQDPAVGVVFVGVLGPTGQKMKRFLLKKKIEKKNRQDIRQESAIFALDFLQSCIRMGEQKPQSQ